MTVPSGSAHGDAILSLITATGVRVFDGTRVPTGTALPYCILYQGSGDAERTRMAARSDRLDLPFQVTSVGLDRRGAQYVADRVRAAVLDVKPVVVGRTSWPIWQDTSQPLRRDDDVTPPLLYLVDVYAWSTTPAPV